MVRNEIRPNCSLLSGPYLQFQISTSDFNPAEFGLAAGRVELNHHHKHDSVLTWQTDQRTDRQADGHPGRQTDRKAGRHTGRQTGRQIDKQDDGQRGRLED